MISSILVATAFRTSKSCSEMPCCLAVSRTAASTALSWAAEAGGSARSSFSSCFSWRTKTRTRTKLHCKTLTPCPFSVKINRFWNKRQHISILWCSSCVSSPWCVCVLLECSQCAQNRACINTDSLDTPGTAVETEIQNQFVYLLYFPIMLVIL